MTALELAKGLSQNQIYGDDYGLFNIRIQNMLRQQADEIESLRHRVVKYELDEIKAKTLTDEEIDKLWHSDEFYEEWTDGSISAIHYNKFARAILRKVNEK